MSRKHPGEIAAGVAAFSHEDRVRIVKEAKRMRAEAMTELIRAAGRGIMRMGRAVIAPLVSRASPGEPARLRGRSPCPRAKAAG
jgi:hypothetical protein